MTESEFRAYPYIASVLKNLGWDVRHPRRGGSVYTQGEFRDNDPLLHNSLKLKTPENIVVIPWNGGLRYWIVEAKANHKDLTTATDEARTYAELVNEATTMPDGIGPARFVTGIAGTPDSSFFVTTEFFDGERWSEVAINDYQTTGFLSLEQCCRILDRNDAHLAVFDDDPDRFLAKANAINRTLQRHEVPVGDRAKIIAALLLALAQDGNLRVHPEPRALIREINGHIEDLLTYHGKREFAQVVSLTLPATAKNHRKFRQAIVDTMQHLREMNIRSAINGTDDALGKFYETFLKYANGAKEMGIVLTPRHITRFAADVVNVGPEDRVLDPACGTGGFLISAMESMRSHPDYHRFTKEGIYGIEQRDDVYGLALVNMIFRGDGKSNVTDGNCFDHEFWESGGEVRYHLHNDTPTDAKRPFTRIFMNPPYKLQDSPETKFVDYALRQLRESGILFAVLPYAVVGGSRTSEWRRELLRRHTLLASIQFDKNLFYPVAEATYGLLMKAHVPHRSSNPVFMGRLFDDEHRPRRSKMLADHEAKDNVAVMTNELRRFLLGQPVAEQRPREQAVVTIDSAQPDFSPERYMPNKAVSVDPTLRAIGTTTAKLMVAARQNQLEAVGDTMTFPLKTFVDIESAKVATIKEHKQGSIPLVSATATNNGIANWLDIADKQCHTHCITVSLLHNTKPCQAFWHPYKFAALSGKVMVLKPTQALLAEPDAIIYLCEAITACNSWRYHYARSPQLDELNVELPAEGGKANLHHMARLVRSFTA